MREDMRNFNCRQAYWGQALANFRRDQARTNETWLVSWSKESLTFSTTYIKPLHPLLQTQCDMWLKRLRHTGKHTRAGTSLYLNQMARIDTMGGNSDTK